MATGYTAIFLTPSTDVMAIPDGWLPDYDSDPFEARSRDEDRLVDFDHEPTPEEQAAQLAATERIEELRQWGEALWRLRVRYPVSYTVEKRGANPTRIFVLSDAKLPAAWGRKAAFWWVHSTAANLKTLHTHIYTTLGFGPVAGALAALDPADPSKFLPKAVQTATSLSNAQQVARVTAMRNALVTLGYGAAEMSKIVAQPANYNEDGLIRALVADLGFTMGQLFTTMIRMD